MTLDLDIMKQIVHDLYVTAVLAAYGEVGVSALREVLEKLHLLYRFVNPEQISGSLIVCRRLEDEEEPLDFPIKPKLFKSPEFLAMDYAPSSSISSAVIQVRSSGEFLFWKEVSIDPIKLSESAIVYLYKDYQEEFIVRGYPRRVHNPSSIHASVFAVPAFRSLMEALEDYKWRSIRTSRCQIFSSTWPGGQNSHRLFFVSKPEVTMRRSLTQYLQNVLRWADVQPEKTVDESHPVDIQVSWKLTNRLAIIEVKWMGDSLTGTGKFTSFREARANEGAKQLADYLDAKHKWAPDFEIMGYLVVIDARRKGLTTSSTSIDRENGFWYADREVQYDPEYHEMRSDFAEPIRMFTEPICKPN